MKNHTTELKAESIDGSIFGLDSEKVNLIKSTVADQASPDELKLFLYQCSRTGLDPLAKQIYFQKRYNRRRQRYEMTIITGIDGYRLIADRTNQYAGNDDPVFDDELSPRKATVTVYKIIHGTRCAFTASARWDQYYPGDDLGFMWRKMPHLMLGKCAEALALRKAFPAELSGIYIKEEMDQADIEAPVIEEQFRKDFSDAAIYNGSELHREHLRKAFEKFPLENKDKHIIAGLMHGQSLNQVEKIIRQFLKEKDEKFDKPVKEESAKKVKNDALKFWQVGHAQNIDHTTNVNS